MLNIQEKIALLHQLGSELTANANAFQEAIQLAIAKNRWFTPESILQSLGALARNYLNEDTLKEIAKHYALENYEGKKRIGLVLAGNLPLVGFHDILCSFICDHISIMKLSEKDSVLTKALIDYLIDIEPKASMYFEFVDRLKNFDAVIATGSNSTAGYFESYFGQYPHVIRKNRNGVALLRGNESEEDIIALGKDIFSYFGLGCRNVSHLVLPRGYDFDFLMGTLHDHYKEVVLHNKYKNNFDFNYATWLMNKVDFLMSGSILLTKNDQIPSSIATLHYTHFDDIEALNLRLIDEQDLIQCVVCNKKEWDLNFGNIPVFDFGKAQEPAFRDYADGVDTIQFLLGL